MQSAGCPCCAYQQPLSGRRLFSRATVNWEWAAGASKRKVAVDSGPTRTLLLDGGTIVDPRDGSTAVNISVRIRNGRIVDVSPRDAGREDSATEVIDAAGRFIVPGYNDMHSHALNLADPSASLALMLAEGVTGFRQMSGSPALLKKRRDNALPIGPAAPALLETPGTVLTPLNSGSSKAVAAEIRRQRDQGADFVKMVMAGPDVFMAAVEEAVAVGIPILGHLQEGVDIVAASQAGFRSVEHLGPGSPLWTACSAIDDELRSEAYARPVIKGPPIKIPLLERIVTWRMQSLLVNPAAFSDPIDVARIQRALDTYSADKAAAVAAELARHGTWQVPTLVRLRSMQFAGAPEYESDESLAYLPAKNIKRWRTVTAKFLALPAEAQKTYQDLYPRQLSLVKLFADNGVRMMTGTDGGSMMAPGLTLRQEFGELAKAGFSPLKILQMSTINPAQYLGREDTMGTVEPGRSADLVVLDANPLDNVENLHRINAVVRAGTHYSAAQLAALKVRAKASA